MSLTLNARQQALLIAVVRNMTADIDWDKVADETDYGTAKSARDNWHHTRKKIENTFSGATGASGGTPVKKGIARKRKAGDEKETPAKKKSKKKVEKEMSPADEDDVEEKKVVKDEVKDEDDDEDEA